MGSYWNRFGLREGDGLLALGESREALEPLRNEQLRLGNAVDVSPVAVLDLSDVGPRTIDVAERAVIEAALRATGGDKLRAARQLGMGKSTLYRKLRSYASEA